MKIEATRAYKKTYNNKIKNTFIVSWILINDNEKTRTYLVTYNDIQPKNYDIAENTYFMSDNDRKFAKKLKEYTQTPVSDCTYAYEIEKTNDD